MPLDPLQAIAIPESAGCTNNYNPKSSATGCFQFLSGSWDQWAPATGISLAQCPTAASCPISDQFAVAANYYNSAGFAPWAPYDSNLATTIAQNGGAGAYAQPGTLSINPATYAALDSPATLQAYFAGTGTGSGTVGTPSLSAAMADPSTAAALGAGTALPPVNAQPGVLSTPFTWTYQQVITVTQQNVTNDINQMQAMVGTYILPLATLALVSLLIRMLWGRYLINHAASWVAKLAIVVPLVASGSSLYAQFVVGPVFGFPAWFQQYAISPTAGGFNASSPAAIFDQVYTSTASTSQKIWTETHGLINDVENAIGLTAAKFLINLSLAALFIPFVVLTLLSMVAAILGPILIPFALFQETAFVFRNWIWATATIVLSLFAIDIVLAMYANVMTMLIQSMAVSGTADNDQVGFWGAAVVMMLLGFSAAYVPALVSRIGSGVSVSMASAAYYMSAGPLRNGAMRVLNAPSTMLRRWTGI